MCDLALIFNLPVIHLENCHYYGQFFKWLIEFGGVCWIDFSSEILGAYLSLEVKLRWLWNLFINKDCEETMHIEYSMVLISAIKFIST